MTKIKALLAHHLTSAFKTRSSAPKTQVTDKKHISDTPKPYRCIENEGENAWKIRAAEIDSSV